MGETAKQQEVGETSSTGNHPLVSVIIPAYNEERLIGAAIGSVLRSNSALTQQRSVEIIVADNTSTDSTADVATRAGARVIQESKRQIARVRNAGASVATGKYLIFLDADSEMHPEHMQRVVALLDSGKVIGGGAVIQMECPWDYRLFVQTWNLISVTFRLAAGSFLFCERETFEQVGGFDETLYAGEELSLSQKLKAVGRGQGKKLVIISDHPVTTSNRKIVDHSRWQSWRILTMLALRGAKGLRDAESCRYWYPDARK